MGVFLPVPTLWGWYLASPMLRRRGRRLYVIIPLGGGLYVMIVQKGCHGNSFVTPTSLAIPKSKTEGGVKMALLLLVMGLRYSTDQRFRPWPSLIPTSGNLTQTSQVVPMKSKRPATPPMNAYIYLTLPMRRVLTSPS